MNMLKVVGRFCLVSYFSLKVDVLVKLWCIVIRVVGIVIEEVW